MTAFTAPSLTVPHGFFGAGAGDCSLAKADPQALANRYRAADSVLPGAALVAAYQIHSPDCLIVAEPWPDANRPRADALVTDRRGILLSIVTADCAPVLLADESAGVIGAAHVGWRGALDGVTDRTIAAMLGLGARIERIAVAIGPAIAQRNYEVDEAFRARFLADDTANDRFFADGPSGQPHFDLEAFVVARLAAAGVTKVAALGLDTYTDDARFFSYRRATHRGESDYGRQLSVIGLEVEPGSG